MKYILFLLVSCNALSQASQQYITFGGQTLSLYAWEGEKVMLLSEQNDLDANVMESWLAAMDATYDYYTLCTGREPSFYTGVTHLNGKSTIAQVPSTCGAGCGYLGWTGIELLDTYFNNMYNYILVEGLYDQIPFYEFGRNFWFYGPQLAYLENDPIATGFAVFMRFKSMQSAGVAGAPFNGSLAFESFKQQIINLLGTYMANNTYTWQNTLGIGQGVPGSGWGATDLFASFCFNLTENYGGEQWVQNVWQYAGQRPPATTNQEAVDNFIIASSQAANENLISLFEYWKWPVSQNAINEVNALGLEKVSEHFSVYPNPATTTLNIEVPDNVSIDEITITDLSGKTVMEQRGNSTLLNVENLAAGMYFTKLKAGDKNYVQKFIKE